jgi:hypothetical protein
MSRGTVIPAEFARLYSEEHIRRRRQAMAEYSLKAGTSDASNETLIVASHAALFRHESRVRCLLAIPAGTARHGNISLETTFVAPLVPAFTL